MSRQVIIQSANAKSEAVEPGVGLGGFGLGVGFGGVIGIGAGAGAAAAGGAADFGCSWVGVRRRGGASGVVSLGGSCLYSV